MPVPMAIRADPALDMTVFTSAKSRLIRPGSVISSEMPWMPWRSTSSTTRRADSTGVFRSITWSRRSLGMVIRVSTFAFRAWDALFGHPLPSRSLEDERLGHHAHGERAHLLGDLGDHRGGAGAGAAAHAGGDEHHVCPEQDVVDLLDALLSRLGADAGVPAGAQPLGQLVADAQAKGSRLDASEGLLVGIDRYELDPPHLGLNHPVDGIPAAASATDHDDPWHAFLFQLRPPVEHCLPSHPGSSSRGTSSSFIATGVPRAILSPGPRPPSHASWARAETP